MALTARAIIQLLAYMKKCIWTNTLSLLTSALLFYTLRSQGDISWDELSGFVPSEVVINTGDTVYWVNNDEFFPVEVTSDVNFPDPNYFDFILADYGESQGWTFNNPGTYGYHSNWGEHGTVVVNNPTVVTNITLSAPRVSGGQFVFEVAGLTIGKTNVLQTSTTLTNWTAVQTNVATSASTTITNTIGQGSLFYRLFETR